MFSSTIFTPCPKPCASANPTNPFTIFRVSKFGDRQTFSASETSIDGIRGSRIVKGSVGNNAAKYKVTFRK